MKRKILSLILCCALLLSLSACGKAEAPQPAADAGTETAPDSGLPAAAEGISYADAYTQYTAIYGALLSAVQQRLDAHDARLQAAYPDSYYMNSDYLLLVYVPFMTAYPSLGRGLRNLKGHRVAGGMRASLYNAMPEEGVLRLVETMKEFEAKHHV